MTMGMGFWATRTVATKVVATDGTGDFTDIQSAIDALPDEGGVVYIKEGTYTITSTITINKDNVALIGAGKATKIQTTTHSRFLHAENVEGIIIKDIFFSDSVDNRNGGIRFVTVSNSMITGCWFDGIRYTAIYLVDDCNRVLVSHNILTNGWGTGIGCEGATNTIITNNIVTDYDLEGISIKSYTHEYDGIGEVKSDYSIITGNHCNNNGYNGIIIQAKNCILKNNICKNNDVGIFIGTLTDPADTDGNVIVGNISKNNTSVEIFIYGTNCIVTSNICNGTAPIKIQDEGINTEIAHNQI